MMTSFISLFENVLREDFCQMVIDRFEKDHHKMPGEMAGKRIDRSIKRTTEVLISGREDWGDVVDILQNSLTQYLKIYQEIYPLGRKIMHNFRDEGFRIKKYGLGDFFDWHTDSGGWLTSTRFLAIQWYFNTVTSGGETEFRYQDIQIKPRTGSMLFFPTGWTYEHRGAPVISSPKYISTTFLRFLPPSSILSKNVWWSK